MIVLGIDGTNWVHALYHALRGVGVLSHFKRRVEILAQHVNAQSVLVCFDRRCFRHDQAPDYKANRREKDEMLRRLLAEAPEAAAECGNPVYQDGYEADDCLATLAAIAVASGSRCVLASADKDLWQCLVDGMVSVLRRFGTHDGDVICPEWQTARELEIAADTSGLRPSQWVDYQSLVGQPGDNVPGCPAWGAKTARAVLVAMGSIDAALANPWSLPCSRSQVTKLQNWAKSELPLVRELVTLKTDVGAVVDALR